MPPKPTLYFAIPVMDELHTLPQCLRCIEQQSYTHIQVVVCINQPEEFRNNPEKKSICDNNALTLDFLNGYTKLPITIMDFSSEGKGWMGKKHGVGWARKTVMDYISDIASDTDIIVSMDADTLFNEGFAESIVDAFHAHQKAAAVAMPYYHKLTGDAVLDRSLLRYEIYMRYYAINLWRIKNPYCFSALGSSMAVPVSVYRAIGGMSPKLSGEDFYFLQKIRKYGSMIVWNEEATYPAARYSDRVFFGTGPQLIKGKQNDWESYPMYAYHLFDEIETTFQRFDSLFLSDVDTPMSAFLSETFSAESIWEPLRKNFKSLNLFRKSCCEKVDGLRILQFLKSKQQACDHEETYLIDYLQRFHKDIITEKEIQLADVSFDHTSLEKLNQIRDVLMEIENNYRKCYKIIDWY